MHDTINSLYLYEPLLKMTTQANVMGTFYCILIQLLEVLLFKQNQYENT